MGFVDPVFMTYHHRNAHHNPTARKPVERGPTARKPVARGANARKPVARGANARKTVDHSRRGHHQRVSHAYNAPAPIDVEALFPDEPSYYPDSPSVEPDSPPYEPDSPPLEDDVPLASFASGAAPRAAPPAAAFDPDMEEWLAQLPAEERDEAAEDWESEAKEEQTADEQRQKMDDRKADLRSLKQVLKMSQMEIIPWNLSRVSDSAVTLMGDVDRKWVLNTGTRERNHATVWNVGTFAYLVYTNAWSARLGNPPARAPGEPMLHVSGEDTFDIVPSIVGYIIVTSINAVEPGSKSKRPKPTGHYRIQAMETALPELARMMFSHVWWTLSLKRTPFRGIDFRLSNAALRRLRDDLVAMGVTLSVDELDVMARPADDEDPDDGERVVLGRIVRVPFTDANQDELSGRLNLATMGVYGSAGAMCGGNAAQKLTTAGFPIPLNEGNIQDCKRSRRNYAPQRSARVGPAWYDYYRARLGRAGITMEQRAQLHAAMLLAYPSRYAQQYPEQYALLTGEAPQDAAPDVYEFNTHNLGGSKRRGPPPRSTR